MHVTASSTYNSNETAPDPYYTQGTDSLPYTLLVELDLVLRSWRPVSSPGDSEATQGTRDTSGLSPWSDERLDGRIPYNTLCSW